MLADQLVRAFALIFVSEMSCVYVCILHIGEGYFFSGLNIIDLLGTIFKHSFFDILEEFK